MKRVTLVSLAAVGGAALGAASCTPEIPHTTIEWTERRAVLDNGLKVVVLPDTTTQLVQVDIRYEVGANEDPPGKAGLAHLVEHMMFQHRPLGPDKPPTFQIIPQLATTFNAYTIWDKTHYYIQAPKEDLETVLRLEAFRLNAGCDTIPPEEFEREREVVRNEIRQRGGTAQGLIPDILGKALYPDGHAYSHTVGGDDAQLSNITFEDVCDFMQKYYVPERAMLLIAGNVDDKTAGQLVQANFGGIPRRPPAPRVEVTPIELVNRTIDETLDIERPVLFVAWKLPSRDSDDWDNVNALSLGASKMAGLAREYDDCIRDAGGTVYGGDLAPVFLMTMELCDNEHFDEALAWVWKGAKGGSWGLKNLQLDEDTKTLAKQSFIEGLESLPGRTGWMAEFLQLQKGKYQFTQERQILFDELDRLDRLSAGGYAGFAKRTFQKDRAVVVQIKASDKGKKGDTRSGLTFSAKSHDKDVEPLVDPAEAKRPLPAPRTASILGSAERYSLGNGMQVVLLPTRSPLPIVQARIVFRAGAAHESPSKAGLASIAARALAPERDADFMKTGVWVAGYADDDATVFGSGGLSMYTDVIVTALERVLKVGTYDQKRLEDNQKRVRQAFDSKQYRESRAFQEELYAALFGAKHPYTTNGSPTKESVGGIGYDAATAWKRDRYEAKNATLIVVGAFDAAKMKSLISDTFGEWGSGNADKPVAPTQAPRSGPIYKALVASKEQPSMEVYIGYPSPAGMDGLRGARMVLAEMLTLRMEKIRSELGSTYGVRASLSANVGPNMYLIEGGGGAAATIDAPRAGESLKAMRDKIDGLRRGDDFDRDFVIARRAVLKRLIGQSSDTQSLVSRLATMATFGLSPDHYDKLTAMVAAVSPAMVKAVISAELKPETEVVIGKGNRPVLEKAFAEAGLPAVDFVEPK
jgi:zinc protease